MPGKTSKNLNPSKSMDGNFPLEPIIDFLRTQLQNSIAEFPDVPPEEKMAAVLVPLLKKDGEWSLLFTRRADNLVDHRGEVSFPGGAVEKMDHDFVATALRETWEEIGLPPDKITILGSLHAFHTVSGYFLKPVIGVMDWPVDVRNNPGEVARTFCIPIRWLSNQNNWDDRPRKLQNGETVSVIHYHLYEGEILWGITARITHELIKLINKMPEK